jgi:hypothetical protein
MAQDGSVWARVRAVMKLGGKEITGKNKKTIPVTCLGGL